MRIETPNFFPKNPSKTSFFFQNEFFSAEKRASSKKNRFGRILKKKIGVLFASNLALTGFELDE